MPTFPSPEPITASIVLTVGDVRITATRRTDTVVQISPSDSLHDPDVRAAEQTQVEFSAGRLLIKSPKQRGLGIFGRVGSVDLTIELPTGSSVEGEGSVVAYRTSGRLGECRIKTSTGDLQLDTTGTLDASTGAGAITVNRVDGDASVSTGSGKVRVREVTGAAVIQNSNGDNWIGEVTGDLRAKTANGDISVDRVHSGITAATANGDVRIGEVARGSASLKTACGEIEIGIRPGTAARLEVQTSFGRVHNTMKTVEGPQGSDERVDVRAHTSYGDIVIHHSQVLDESLRGSTE